ncbi:enoyl-CoA hydratase [Ruegeria lacuscaerulensis ITI-1157]|nr:enoyl-CoA hydratase [Ruegeria lacuscaerulensis ITI-1157]
MDLNGTTESSDLMAFETIIVEIEDHVALIKLNRPDALTR